MANFEFRQTTVLPLRNHVYSRYKYSMKKHDKTKKISFHEDLQEVCNQVHEQDKKIVT